MSESLLNVNDSIENKLIKDLDFAIHTCIIKGLCTTIVNHDREQLMLKAKVQKINTPLS